MMRVDMIYVQYIAYSSDCKVETAEFRSSWRSKSDSIKKQFAAPRLGTELCEPSFRVLNRAAGWVTHDR